MNIDALVAQIWGESGDPASPSCPAAEEFAQFAQELLEDGFFSVDQKIALVTKKYWSYYYQVPKAHRIHGQGHRCIWHVFKEYSDKLMLLALRERPSPPTPPAPYVLPAPPPNDDLIIGVEGT